MFRSAVHNVFSKNTIYTLTVSVLPRNSVFFSPVHASLYPFIFCHLSVRTVGFLPIADNVPRSRLALRI